MKEHFCNYKASQAKANNPASYLSTSQDTNFDNNNNKESNIESIYRLSNENSSNNSNSIASTLINKYKMLDNIFLPFVNPLVPREEILNSISYCK